MNGMGPYQPLIVEVNHRINDLRREAEQDTLRKQALEANPQPSTFSRLLVSLMSLMKTQLIERPRVITDDNFGQPVLKRSTATVHKV